MLWRKFANALIERVLRFRPGAKIVIENAGGAAPTEISAAELKALDGLSAELALIDGLTASATELNRAADVSGRLVAAGSTLTVTMDEHDGKTILLDTAAGCTVTLPAASGSGGRLRFVVTVTPTSNQHRINCVGNDAMFGAAILAQDSADTVVMFETAADTDRINMNGTTQGGIKGAVVELEDVAADTWAVQIRSAASGTEATPFVTGQVS